MCAALGVAQSTGATADVIEGTGAAVGMVGAIVPHPAVKLAGLAFLGVLRHPWTLLAKETLRRPASHLL